MDEIYKASLDYFVKKNALLRERKGIPAHVRNLSVITFGKSDYLAFEKSEAFHSGIFLTGFEKQLKAEAYAEYRFTVIKNQFFYDIGKTVFV